MINLYEIDCLEFMKSKPNKSYALAIVDPPYGIGEDGNKTKSRNTNRKDPRNGKEIICGNDYSFLTGWDNQQPSQEYFDELFRVPENVIIFGENYLHFEQKASSSGRIVWDKVNGESDFSDCEIAWTNLFTSVRLVKYMWAGFNQGVSIQKGSISQGNKKLTERRIHPTQKPIKLYEWLLSQYAQSGDKILDTHGGSGSIAIACSNLGFDLDICENHPVIFERMLDRYETHIKQQRLFSPDLTPIRPEQLELI